MTKLHFPHFQKWWQVLAALFALLLLLGVIGCVIFYNYCAVYEQTRPEIPMDELMAAMDKDDWLQELVKTAPIHVNEFEDASKLYTDFFNASLRDADFSYRSSISESSSTRKVFVVRAGGMNVCQVAFAACDDTRPGFGRHTWALSDITVSDYTRYLSSIDVEVSVPSGRQVLINDRPVSDTYYTGETDCPDTSPIEFRFSDRMHYRCYDVGAMYGTVTVTDSEGNEISAFPDEKSGKYLYQYIPDGEELYNLTIEAPSDVVVTLNGTVLTSDDVSEAGEDIFRHYPEYYHGAEWSTVVYSFPHLYTKPEITAADPNGNELIPVFSDNGKVNIFYATDEALQAEMEETAHTFFDAYIAYSGKHFGLFDMLALVLPNSQLRAYIQMSSEAVYWSSRTYAEYSMLEFSNFRPVGDQAFFCTVRYKANMTANNWYETYDYELSNGYQLVFIQYGKRWYAAEMSAFS